MNLTIIMIISNENKFDITKFLSGMVSTTIACISMSIGYSFSNKTYFKYLEHHCVQILLKNMVCCPAKSRIYLFFLLLFYLFLYSILTPHE